MLRFGRRRRSVRSPPRGTERIVTQIARLTTKPASPSERPRAISIAGPNATTATRLALKQPHARPALTASPTSRAASPARRARGAPAAPPAVRDGEAVAGGGHEAAHDHEREAAHHRSAYAQALADDAARQREESARQHVEADEQAELCPGEPELGDEERSDGGDGLELIAHRCAGDEHDRQRHPAVGHVPGMIADGGTLGYVAVLFSPRRELVCDARLVA